MTIRKFLKIYVAALEHHHPEAKRFVFDNGDIRILHQNHLEFCPITFVYWHITGRYLSSDQWPEAATKLELNKISDIRIVAASDNFMWFFGWRLRKRLLTDNFIKLGA